MYLSSGNHSFAVAGTLVASVVNCFQNVSFQWKSQQLQQDSGNTVSCELLSKCIFPVEITAIKYAKELSNGCELLSKCIFPVEITAHG
uniref:hypothetical protein n=1 Tax=Algoriphagus antarcticus TaxID=238540 RepID=UPI000A368984|nr:hypothetical protein [Algoriphagus antarcticus]